MGWLEQNAVMTRLRIRDVHFKSAYRLHRGLWPLRTAGGETIPDSLIVYESCHCGDVRTITISADQAPIIRYGEVYNRPSENKAAK